MAWRRRSWDLRASAIAASASARLRRTSSHPERARARAKRRLRAFRPARASTPCFRFFAFRDSKLNFTRPSRALRPPALGQVSEKKVILPGAFRTRRSLRACFRAAAHGGGRAQTRSGAAISDRSGAKLRARLNQFPNRTRLHASREYSCSRARILVNAGYGYCTLKKRRVETRFGHGGAGGRFEAPFPTLMRRRARSWAIRTSA